MSLNARTIFGIDQERRTLGGGYSAGVMHEHSDRTREDAAKVLPEDLVRHRTGSPLMGKYGESFAPARPFTQ